MNQVRYGFVESLEGRSFEEALEQVRHALEEQGFGILTEIDVQKTLKQKLDADFRRYVILGACNPALAKQALDSEDQIGLLLPCNVVVQESPEQGVLVSIADPLAMFTLVENSAVIPVAEEAERRLRKAMRALV